MGAHLALHLFLFGSFELFFRTLEDIFVDLDTLLRRCRSNEIDP